ncbi:hypothetical protein BCV69DRAFT_130932 [Microstroma glucosiphilum]|uniref:Uncharacterized protein n=1 Tax=Pseudomicrostroma glucosiphilum TaxID=1684307 RepID=A0A316TVV4_9BASI|nr:hypothetical protein BCV69DRAFT_130932 [Pseudomicrostroma glucosiphilum]PWN17666.1 hypothetical protein BCV69DRAFT_130932 [Pseudomicrostroma glucosiphilum]
MSITPHSTRLDWTESDSICLDAPISDSLRYSNSSAARPQGAEDSSSPLLACLAQYSTVQYSTSWLCLSLLRYICLQASNSGLPTYIGTSTSTSTSTGTGTGIGTGTSTCNSESNSNAPWM